jgi:hypothetical protein
MHGVIANRRRSVTFVLAISSVSFLPLIVLNSPDPLWVVGVYDGADLDDLVVTDVRLPTSPDASAVEARSHRMVRRLASAAPAYITAVAHPVVGSRAPPFFS